MTRSARFQTGFALVAALLAIVLIAILVTGALFASGQEARSTRNELIEQQALAYAERAVVDATLDWNSSRDVLAIGGFIGYTPQPDPPFESTVIITRLDSALYQVLGEGRATPLSGFPFRRRVAVIVRTRSDSAGVVRATRVSAQAWVALFQM